MDGRSPGELTAAQFGADVAIGGLSRTSDQSVCSWWSAPENMASRERPRAAGQATRSALEVMPMDPRSIGHGTRLALPLALAAAVLLAGCASSVKSGSTAPSFSQASSAPATQPPTVAKSEAASTAAVRTPTSAAASPVVKVVPTHPPAPLSSHHSTAAPVTSAASVTTAAPPPPPSSVAPAGCHPLTNGGNCYEPGEYCRNDDHGMTGLAGDGKTITCEDNDGWRWEPS
jgi:hypothetical protein